VLTRPIAKMLGGKASGHNPFTLRDEIFALMQMSSDDGDIDPKEKGMIRRLFDFEETPARNVMMPLIDVVGIEQGATCGEAMRLAREQDHKRMPVYAQRVDRIVGVLDALELLGVESDEPITSFIRPVDHVPGSKSIQALLMDMQRDRQLLSVVVDVFGGAEGIVTVEDIIEEIVEDIADEYDAQETSTQWVRKLGEQDYLVSARIDPDLFTEELGIRLPAEQFASLAGFLLERVRDVPAAGDVINYKKLTFIIQRGSARAIEEVRVRW